MAASDDTIAVLEQLRRNATLDTEAIAERTGLGPAAVDEAREVIHDRGLVDSYAAVVDPAAVGHEESSYHFIGAIDNYDDTLRNGVPEFNDWGGSQLAMVGFGNYDMIFRKVSKSEERLDRFAQNLITNPKYPSLRETSTYRINERYRWNGADVEENQYGQPVCGLDDDRREVLSVLQADGNLRNRPGKVAERADIATGEAAEIIDELEEDGVILGYTALPDVESLGWYRGFLGLSNLENSYEGVVDNLLELEPLYAPYIVSGTGATWADIGIEFVCRSIEHLDELTDRIRVGLDARESRTLLSPKVFQNKRTVNVDPS
ncbi:Lrp/AsnC family transcriptional regulator [Halorubrum sp. SP9]|uniref:Lrp/AsnC family transcriptional regulator n=1 Tax=Halorubrum sp. SP9 TaxID=1537267 RepID=UPI0010F905AC|nr:Lrp/AsnC family transcriptional regulator [Halorubrum sp. SP9]TKX67667.1 Lrp/AsnC family transcriptional regulator [Halorubrum sp. SP9]